MLPEFSNTCVRTRNQYRKPKLSNSRSSETPTPRKLTAQFKSPGQNQQISFYWHIRTTIFCWLCE